MAVLRIRLGLSRFIVVAVVAIMLATWAFTAVKPSQASAACSTSWRISRGYLAMRDMFYAVGMYEEGNYYGAMADVYGSC